MDLKSLENLIRTENTARKFFTRVYVGKTTVVSAVDVTATKYTESTVIGLDVNAVNTLSMISTDAELTKSGLAAAIGFELLSSLNLSSLPERSASRSASVILLSSKQSM